MQNRKGLFTLLVIGAIILGLASVFNYGSAIGPETIQFKDGKIGENYDAEYEPKISGALPAFGWSAEAPVLTYISSYGLNGALQFLTGTPSKNLPIRGTPKKTGTMQALVTFHYMGKSGWLPGVPVPKTKDYIVKINILDEKGSLPTPTTTPDNNNFAIDASGLKDGILWVPYSGILKAINVPSETKMLRWQMTKKTWNTLESFGLKCANCEFSFSLKAEGPEIFIVNKTVGTPKKTGLVSGTFDLEALSFPKTIAKTSINFQFYIKEGDPGSNMNLAIDLSGLKAGAAGKPYSGAIKAKNAKNPKWTLGNNNLSEFGLTAPATSFGGNFSIKSINSTSAKEGTATGTITLISRIGKAEGGGVETDEISGDFKIEIKKGGGGGGVVTSPKINSFKFDNGKKSMTVAEGDSITFKWEVSNATDVQIIGRLTPQSATDPAGQKNICEELETKKCGLAGELKVNIYRSSAFTLKAKNTLNGKSKTSTSAVYVIVKPKSPEKFGTVVVEGTLFSDQHPDGKPYTGRVTPADAFRFFKNGAEQEKININSLPKVFNRAKGNYKIETEIGEFQLFSATGKKITASLKDISPADRELKPGGTTRLNINFKTKTTVVSKKYSCNAQNACVRDDANGTFSDSNCNNACGGSGEDLTITTATLADATVGAVYSQSLSAAGGTAPYLWSITSGKLPSGLTLNSAGVLGVLSGTPKKEGTVSFTVKVVDAKSKFASKELKLTVASAAVVSSCKDGGKPNPDNLNCVYMILQTVDFACPTDVFLKNVVEKLNAIDSRWGYHKHPTGKKGANLKWSYDRIAWYKGSGTPVSGSNEVLAYDIISNYDDCRSAKLRSPKLTESSEFNFKDQWIDPDKESITLAEIPIVAELEIEDLTPTPDLALVGEVVAPNKSLIARGLDAMDSISLPIQFYTEKFFRDMTDASFWKKVKKGLEKTKIAPKRKMKTTPSPTK